MLCLLAKSRVVGLSKKRAASKTHTEKIIDSSSFVALKSAEKRIKRWVAPKKMQKIASGNALFRPRMRFWRIFGSRIEPKIHEKCVRKSNRKNAKNKTLTCARMRWVGVMRGASGRGWRVHTSYEFPPKGACRIMQSV